MTRKRRGIQLAYPLEERRLTESKFGWAGHFPVICQPKLNGERCRIICRGHKDPILLSSTEEIITSVPHISEIVRRKCLHVELDGELYVHGMSFNDIHSIISRTVNLHEDHENMEFHIFDLIQKSSQIERLLTLTENFNFSSHPLFKVDFDLAFSVEEIMFYYEKYVSAGYEGIIVRHKLSFYDPKHSRFMLKFKPKKSDVYKIIGYKQMKDKNKVPKNMLGALVLASNEGTIFSVGSGMSNPFRTENWPNPDHLIEKYCRFNYQHMSPDQVPIFGTFVEILDKNPEEEPEEEFGGIL